MITHSATGLMPPHSVVSNTTGGLETGGPDGVLLISLPFCSCSLSWFSLCGKECRESVDCCPDLFPRLPMAQCDQPPEHFLEEKHRTCYRSNYLAGGFCFFFGIGLFFCAGGRGLLLAFGLGLGRGFLRLAVARGYTFLNASLIQSVQ